MSLFRQSITVHSEYGLIFQFIIFKIIAVVPFVNYERHCFRIHRLPFVFIIELTQKVNLKPLFASFHFVWFASSPSLSTIYLFNFFFYFGALIFSQIFSSFVWMLPLAYSVCGTLSLILSMSCVTQSRFKRMEWGKKGRESNGETSDGLDCFPFSLFHSNLSMFNCEYRLICFSFCAVLIECRTSGFSINI